MGPYTLSDEECRIAAGVSPEQWAAWKSPEQWAAWKARIGVSDWILPSDKVNSH